ncbi:phage portal protein [Caulobacter sp. NIBR2454]|uniref:phage portal protein n=1 Tax=Caulobacter sp. NIBR2454 TaxID=3015996 RepID=UPI0022B70919|nr:phage portal protein [Caulobacter sp. NIBR2454]
MTFLRRPFGRRRVTAPEIKDSQARRLIALTTAGKPQWTPRDYEALAREGFAKNPVAYRCVRMIAEAAASVPLAVFAKGTKVGDDHPLRKLLDRPNPEQGGPDLMEAFFGGLQIAGNAYLEAGEGAKELYALRPDRMTVIPGRQGWPEAYEYAAGGRKTRIGRAADGWLPVLHLKLFNPADDYYGASPLEAAAFAIDVHNASGAWNKALLDNAARPSGALVYAGREAGDRLSQEQFDQLKAELSDAHTGAAAAGRPLLLEGGLDWKPMSLSPAEMDFIGGKHAAAREIALAFGVPPQLLGIPGDATYANYREANGAFWRQTVLPLAERAARAMTGWLEARFEGCVIACDLEKIPALTAEREALWARLAGASFLTDEERREMAGVDRG